MNAFLQFSTNHSLFHSNKEFGILTIQTDKGDKSNVDKCYEKLAILMTIDISFSMDEGPLGEIKKINQVKQTMIKILKLFSELKNIYVSVELFNTTTQTLFDFTEITNKNIIELTEKIVSIEIDGYTNIENALKNAEEKIMNWQNNHSSHKMFHILLTDGDATKGEKNPYILAEIPLVSGHLRNIFLGFGKDHNSYLLDILSCSSDKNEYWFVDKITRLGMICGEVVHSILYPGIENVYIELEEGEIYNWKTNTWSSELEIKNIPLDSEKIYHIRTTNPSEITGKIKGIYNLIEIDVSLDVLPELKNSVTNCIQHVYLDCYYYRQKVQEIMFESKLENNNIKERVSALYNEIFQVLSSLSSGSDSLILKHLLDDLYVVYKTYGTEHGHMYSTSRQLSNGRQQTYHVSDFSDSETGGRPKLHRETTTTLGPCALSYYDYLAPKFTKDLLPSRIIESHTMSDCLENPFKNLNILRTIEKLCN
jgi:uncharacterized protein YegL